MEKLDLVCAAACFQSSTVVWKKPRQAKKNIFVTRAVKLQKIVKTPFLTECNDISCSRNIIVVFEERKTCFEMHSMLTIKFFLGRFETDLNERPSTFFPVSLSVDCRGTSSPAKTPCVLNNTDYLVCGKRSSPLMRNLVPSNHSIPLNCLKPVCQLSEIKAE